MSYFPQRAFFRAIEAELPEKTSLIQWTADHLDLSYASAQRRVSGEKELSAGELVQLTMLMPVAAQRVLEAYPLRDSSLITDNTFNSKEDFVQYLRNIRSLFQNALKSGDALLQYVAYDIPIFLFLANSRMLEYKFAFWSNRLRDGLEELPPEAYVLSRDIYSIYQQMDSEELWNPKARHIQLRQLELNLESGLLNEGQYAELKGFINRIQEQQYQWAKAEQKEGGGAYRLYSYEDITITNGALLSFGNVQQMMGAYAHVKFFSSRATTHIEGFKQDWNAHIRAAQMVTHGPPGLLKQWQEQTSD
ncbi:hypothetical protein [Croceimicrobium hydrocarbonivorans]|uniref:Uncharacterized protein n=1 Tax=Croceimicrobium hydrocarbonivorans TaxID=2761580 RepID=A0A7H0VEZ9_9FLAO|nr:hypothetical protein [Croceimicrobium hydrocarbonivorans]QNR24297.1 hypothetical protein H4K34_00220 [Croceimicrobium hydrocarbonivorans]